MLYFIRFTVYVALFEFYSGSQNKKRAYFSFSSADHKTLSKTAKAFPSTSCNSCHASAAADDFVFTQYYPVLSQGKGMKIKAGGGYSDSLKPIK